MGVEEDIKKAIEKKTLIIGSNSTIKKLKQGKLSKIILSNNSPSNFKEEILHLAKLSNVDVVESEKNNEGLGILCRKQFKITALGIVKA